MTISVNWEASRRARVRLVGGSMVTSDLAVSGTRCGPRLGPCRQCAEAAE